jgi:hypothetical protein
MKSHKILFRLQSLNSTMLAATLLAAFAAVYVVGIVSSTAQSTQKEERELEDKIPKHLPIKVKVKNLNNEKWARDVGIEVTNTGTKPIYHLLLSLSLPNVFTENNRNLGFPLRYGRGDLIDHSAPLQPDDIPIKPGETYTFKIPEQLQRGWERFVTRRGVSKSEQKKFRLVFQSLNFGDGTGFTFIDAVPVDINQKQADGSCVGDEQNKNIIKSTLNDPPNRSPDSILPRSTLFLPASFQPVKFFPVNTSEMAFGTEPANPDVCGCSGSCSRLRNVTVTCCGMDINKAGSAPCSGSVGSCATYYTEDVSCNDEFGTYCIQDFLLSCASVPTPTPTPTPTPDPTSTPTPTPSPTPCDPDSGTQPNPSCHPFGPCPPQGTRGWICDACSGPIVNRPAYRRPARALA